MFELKVVTHFSAAHQLKAFRGGCETLHGHNWKIEAYVMSDALGDAGVVVDFRELKAALRSIMETLDHSFLNDLPAFKDTSPSSENIARYVADQLAQRIPDPRVRVSRVTAWESENACATFYPNTGTAGRISHL
ncbi:MAG: 6-carboxytetrahydropterin synthase QueD [Deltaproteobacteria bacterium]|nr:6-carboxytetrahydropterin synthase QueD [Deltaproteobacteria bacterium]